MNTLKHKFSTAIILDASIHSFFLVWCAYLLSTVSDASTVSLVAYKVTALMVLILALIVGAKITAEDFGLKIFRSVSLPEGE